VLNAMTLVTELPLDATDGSNNDNRPLFCGIDNSPRRGGGVTTMTSPKNQKSYHSSYYSGDPRLLTAFWFELYGQ